LCSKHAQLHKKQITHNIVNNSAFNILMVKVIILISYLMIILNSYLIVLNLSHLTFYISTAINMFYKSVIQSINSISLRKLLYRQLVRLVSINTLNYY
jgi:hypothetical protein